MLTVSVFIVGPAGYHGELGTVTGRDALAKGTCGREESDEYDPGRAVREKAMPNTSRSLGTLRLARFSDVLSPFSGGVFVIAL